MTTDALTDRSGESRVAVAVEMMVLTVAALGLCLGLLAVPGGTQTHGEAREDGIRATF